MYCFICPWFCCIIFVSFLLFHMGALTDCTVLCAPLEFLPPIHFGTLGSATLHLHLDLLHLSVFSPVWDSRLLWRRCGSFYFSMNDDQVGWLFDLRQREGTFSSPHTVSLVIWWQRLRVLFLRLLSCPNLIWFVALRVDAQFVGYRAGQCGDVFPLLTIDGTTSSQQRWWWSYWGCWLFTKIAAPYTSDN